MMSISRDEKHRLWLSCVLICLRVFGMILMQGREKERERESNESNESNDAEFSAVVVNAFNM